MNGSLHVLFAAAVLPLALACGEEAAGGSGAVGSGGGPAMDPIDVPLASLPMTARSALWAPTHGSNGILPGGHQIVLVDTEGACTAEEGLRLRPGESAIRIGIAALARGDCPIWSWWTDEDLEPPPGCQATVSVERPREDGAVLVVDAAAGRVRIDRVEGTTIAGRVEVDVVDRVSMPLECWTTTAGYGDGTSDSWAECRCETEEGTVTCQTDDDEDLLCCDDEGPVVRVAFDFVAELCRGATMCWTTPCAPVVAAGCEAPPPAVDCDAACAGFVELCAGCTGCPADDEHCRLLADCSHATCLDRCAALGAEVFTATALSCTGEPTCEAWAGCVGRCGR